ncbi:hypothetical protein [Beggiatoa leptomitoformis]|uniref:Uncharacterized protein n=1 Tax=Beggiatoa leptomitoformis TaxID=288004 RepID=A0A650GDT7_9GAMM|nr:hypothetical protein [Beggiatoa leptomitoformis]QGX03590.1 hypothetical protein AL038_18695 [Beggiatoa leptomitoformis]QGX04062.1 hypothetical protein BLE401_18535 [Beggiatoa leptomitoformis]
MLPLHYPQITEWQMVTCMLEQAGLFEQPRKIGFKRYWDALLLSKNIDLDYS